MHLIENVHMFAGVNFVLRVLYGEILTKGRKQKIHTSPYQVLHMYIGLMYMA